MTLSWELPCSEQPGPAGVARREPRNAQCSRNTPEFSGTFDLIVFDINPRNRRELRNAKCSRNTWEFSGTFDLWLISERLKEHCPSLWDIRKCTISSSLRIRSKTKESDEYLSNQRGNIFSALLQCSYCCLFWSRKNWRLWDDRRWKSDNADFLPA